MPTRPRMLAAAAAVLALTSAVLPARAAAYPAADWTLPTPDGGEVNLHEALDRGPVVVAFWATWCIPCLKELPHLEALAEQYEGRATVIAVSVDNSKSMAKVGPLVRARGWDHLVVAQDAAGQVQQKLQVLSPPYTILYDAAGREAYRHEGYRPGDEHKLAAALEAAVTQAAVTRAETGVPGGAVGAAVTPGPGGFAAADWTLPTPGGEEVNFHDRLARGPVVVAFWATWCIPCLKELPHLEQLAEDYAGEVSVIAVSVDNSKSMAKVGPLVRSRGWDDLLVVQDAAGQLQQRLQVLSPPYTILFDAAGREVYRHEGYRPGDEDKLRAAVQKALTAPPRAAVGTAPGGLDWSDAITATDQFEYSYATDTDDEIVENWLDVAYQLGKFRTGVMLNHQGPSEEGDRRNEIVHRYFEFSSGRFDVRAGHFYGMFGRGLVWNSYEDRFIRVDTALDGIYARGGFGPVTIQAMSGATGTTPTLSDPDGVLTTQVDVRGLDAEWQAARGLSLGAAAVTYVPDLLPVSDETRREWVGTGRVSYYHQYASAYLEYGKKTGYEFDPATLEKDEGEAFYGNLGVYLGRVSLSLERSDYDRFRVLERVDGKQPLNRPPALVREHVYSLLGRKPHNLNPNDEKGWQLEANLDLGRGWAVLGNASQVESHGGETLYEEVYGHLEQEHLGDFRFRGGFGYQDSEGAIRQTVVADGTWYLDPALALTAQFEHQHVRLGVLGEYDQQWAKLEADVAGRWSLTAIAEFNNKYAAQFDPGEIRGDFFPAGQITYSLAQGGNLNLWLGKRQAGQVCAGGVCKFEPAFEGVEFYGVFRY